MNKIIGVVSLLVIIFYHIYPQGLSLFGFSFLFTSGLLGIALYIYNKGPYSEVVRVGLAYVPIILLTLLSAYMNNYHRDDFTMNTTRSQIAWFFSAYFIIFLFNLVHPKASVDVLIYYIVAAVVIQGVISIAMHMNPEVYDFFDSIHSLDHLAVSKRAETRGTRLLGYGTAFFGAGIIYGATLVLLTYVIVAKKKSVLKTVITTIVYAFVFFSGLLTARTTMIGLGSSIVLMVVIVLFSRERNTKQLYIFSLLAMVSVTVLQTLANTYFPDFADWAFEAFTNYSETGEFSTESSDSLEHMFILPNDLHTWVFGRASMVFWGSDVGFSRLLFFIGLPGLIAYFFYPAVLVWFSMTKEKALNFTLIGLFFFNVVLNYKGLSDVNGFLCLFFFYFMNYKYFVYRPQVYKQRQQQLALLNKDNR